MKKKKSQTLNAQLTDLPELQLMQQLSGDIQKLLPLASQDIPTIHNGKSWRQVDFLKLCHQWFVLAQKHQVPSDGMRAFLQPHRAKLTELGLDI